MKILLVGASGTIGQAVHAALKEKHDVISASRRSGNITVDLAQAEAIRSMFGRSGPLDAIISTAGNSTVGPLENLTDEDFRKAVDVQMLGQVNLARIGRKYLRDGGSVTLTTGPAAHTDFPGASAIAMACAGVERFVRAAAGELTSVRLNVVSPIYVKETMERLGLPTDGGLSAADTANAYLAALQGGMHGQVLSAPDFV